MSICVSQKNNCINLDSLRCFYAHRQVYSPIELRKNVESDELIRINTMPSIVDIDNDCTPELIVYDSICSTVIIIDSKSGKLKSKFNTVNIDNDASILITGDIDNDAIPELFILADFGFRNSIFDRGYLYGYKMNGTQIWKSNVRVDYNNFSFRQIDGKIGLADFNQDGISELYINNKIFNSRTGMLLAHGGDNGLGQIRATNFTEGTVTVAAQLDENNFDLELAAGYTIYKVSINILNDTTGNSMTPFNILVDGELRDGFTTAGDLDLDKKLEVIVSHCNLSGGAILYAYKLINGNTKLLAKAYPSSLGNSSISVPGICNLRNGNPSIIVAKESKLFAYTYSNSGIFKKDWDYLLKDGSTSASASFFDFDSDGFSEIIYRDEEKLMIISEKINSPNLETVIFCGSATLNEFPLVADLDNSGHAKICVVCANSVNDYTGRLTIFGPKDSLPGWAPARPIWNQYAYNPLYINDDLTVPQHPKNQATYMNGKYNNFMQQESLLDSNGMYKVAAASLLGDITCINYDPVKDEFVITFNVINKKDASRSSGDRWHVTFYDGDPENGGIVIDSILMTKDLLAGDTIHDLMFSFKRSGIKQLFMVVNTSRLGGGTFDDKDFKVLECDYKDNISQWIDFPIVTEIKDVFCESQGYKYKDSTYTKTGKYYYFVRNTEGCDQEVSILDLEARDSVFQEVYYSSCDSIRLIDTTFYNSGSKIYQYKTSYRCDSTIIAHVEIKSSNVKNVSAISCDSIIWNGRIINQSGKYNYLSSNVNGCDSTTILDLIINNSKIINQYKSSCNSYTWNGRTLTQSGDYTHQSSTINGCDSTTILHLTIDTLVRESIKITECQSYNWNGQLITTTGIYLDTFKTINGCDSIVTLDLNIANNGSILSQTSCDQYTWNKKLFTQSGIYYDTLKNKLGCDSIAQLNLTINRNNSNSEFINSCISYNWHNKNLTQSGIYRDTMSTSLGCDSISILNLTIHKPFDTIVTIKSCESYTWNGQILTQSGRYQFNGLTQHNCDSTIQLNLTINKNSVSNINVSVCDSIIILGKTYNQAGVYTIKSLNNEGCDSTINLSLSILSQKIMENKSSCDSFLWNNQIYTQSGIYSIKNTKINGCDSIHQLNLIIHPSFKNNINAQDCKEYYWPSNNTLYNQSGTYLANYNTINGCDSILTLNLTIHQDFEKSDTITSNTSYQWPINQKTYNQSGSYQESFTDINGCDSIYNLLLILNKEFGIYAPNVINPSSNINGYFILYDSGSRADILLLSIYDRWGELLWQKEHIPTSDPSQGWNGRFHDKPVNPGVYVWMAKVRLPNSEKILIHGNVTVVR